MLIDFPKKYTVTRGTSTNYWIDVPTEFREPLIHLLRQQEWIRQATFDISISVWLSLAYEYTDEQAYNALCKLVEHVIEPTPELDPDVWNLDEETE